MCVLCTGAVLHIHWTDRKKGSMEQQTFMQAEESRRTYVRERYIRVRQCNKILGVYGLKLHDWSGSKYVLQDMKGRLEVVQDLGELWAMVEKLLGKPIDPLDPYLIQALKSQLNSSGGDQP